jgi:hypothetical protein
MLTVIFVGTVFSIIIIEGDKQILIRVNGQHHNNITVKITNTDCQMKSIESSIRDCLFP